MSSRVRTCFATLALIITAACLTQSAIALSSDIASVERRDNGITLKNSMETLHVSICGPGVVHIVASPANEQTKPEQTPWITGKCENTSFDMEKSERDVKVKTAQLQVGISLTRLSLSFSSADGTQLLAEEGERPRDYTAEIVNGEPAYRVTDSFSPDETEGMYGLGQHQGGAFNYRGSVVKLAQQNTDVAIPFFISTKGYGIMWNTASPSEFDNRFPRSLSLTANAADGVDYYFFYGPDADQIIHEYRQLTGHSPLLGKWAYGFIQSKDRYTSADQLLKVGAEYRTKNIPLDVIIQDWYWWKHQGDPQYSDNYLKDFPDVPEALRTLHRDNFHAIISVWPRLDKDSATYSVLQNENGLIPGLNIYDPTNPRARDLYWNQIPAKLAAQGWDGFWLDASEPEADLTEKQLFIGNGARYANIFPLMHTGNVYEHWRQTQENRRAFILTRSAFLGEQRNAAVTWSGDIYGPYAAFSRQVPAGLNFALSGDPYWTTDIAGYTSPYDEKSDAYRELYTRWFEYGVFCPIFRTHGHRNNNEIPSYGPVAPILAEYDKLRYRLIPYIYSLAWRVTKDDYTIQRPLVMDWRTVEKVRDVDDEFMFGSSLLVNPVTAEGVTVRPVYLPPGAGWFDFWTGKKLNGDQRILADSPLNRIPLYVRAGSILPLGPDAQYAGQSDDGPVTLRIYQGADASFDLYDDDGASYDYETGKREIIPIHWDDEKRVLSIGAREGGFSGMKPNRTFQVIWVRDGHGAGESSEAKLDKVVHYTGEAVTVRAPDVARRP